MKVYDTNGNLVTSISTAAKIDDFGVCGTTDTTKDSNTTNHGLLLKAVAGASAGFAKAVVCLYGQTIYSLQELYDATLPAVLGTASAGTATTLARRDHVHSAELTLADGKSVEVKVALGTDETVSGTTAIFTDGNTMTIGMVGYVKNSTGFKTFRALATNAGTTMPATVLATNVSGTFLLRGFARHDAWTWTVGGMLYVDASTAGSMTQTPPSASGSIVQVVGYAVTADIIFFNPSMTWIELT